MNFNKSSSIGKFLMIIFLMIFSLEYGEAQQVSPAIVKSAMTYKFAENLFWSNDASLTQYNVGILSNNKEIIQAFTNTLENAKIHKKPIRVKALKSISEIKNLQIVYVDVTYINDIKEILSKSSKEVMLIVSDQVLDKKSVMINFYSEENTIKFEIHKANIINAGLTINPNLILLGGTEIDVAALYKDSQEDLEKEKVKVNQQQQELRTMRNEIEKKKAEIEHQKEEILLQKNEIKYQRDEINLQQKRLSELNVSVVEQQKILDEKVKMLEGQLMKIAQQEIEIKKQESVMSLKNGELQTVNAEIEKQKMRLEEQMMRLEEQKSTLHAQDHTIKNQQSLIYLFGAFFILIIVFIIFIIRSYRAQKRFNRQLAFKNEEISLQKEELQVQTENLQLANNEINEKSIILEELYTEIKDSIRAAEAIQQTILPSHSFIKKHLPESFIYNKPKDIVSGDFYWFDVKDNKIIIAAVDCTGHGVSGAFMSITGHHLLNKCIHPFETIGASKILERLNDCIINDLNKKNEKEIIFDGMDISLCIIDKENKKLEYSGAKSPIYILRDGEIIQHKGDGHSIGLNFSNKTNIFKNHQINLLSGDIVYMFSDGYADQFGGEDGNEKFKYTRFRELILDIGSNTMEQQLNALDKCLQEWRKGHEQLDDILVMGIKIG